MHINIQQMQNYTNLNRIMIAVAGAVLSMCLYFVYEVDLPKPLKFIFVERMEIEFCLEMNKVEVANAYLTILHELHLK